jgi:hypothetical protein
VVQELAHRHSGPRRGHRQAVAADRIVELEFARIDELKNGGGRELLRRGTDAERGIDRHRRTPFAVRNAVGAAKDRPAVIGDHDDAAEVTRDDVLPEKRVRAAREPRIARGVNRRGPRQNRRRQQPQHRDRSGSQVPGIRGGGQTAAQGSGFYEIGARETACFRKHGIIRA